MCLIQNEERILNKGTSYITHPQMVREVTEYSLFLLILVE